MRLGLAPGVTRTNQSLRLRTAGGLPTRARERAEVREAEASDLQIHPPTSRDPTRIRVLEAGRGRNRERGPKWGLGDHLDSPTRAVP